jgi:Raf kinase inhibitor-like YbhB/YbcL family protein
MRKLLNILIAASYAAALSAHAQIFQINTDSFTSHNMMPIMYTCDGKDISPALQWESTPAKTKSLALIVSDIDAPKGIFYHWVLYNIPATTLSFAAGTTQFPAGTVALKNSFNNVRYNGPCPPAGETHHYIFTLYALNTTFTLSQDADALSLIKAMKNHVIGTAELKAVFSH